MLTYRLTHITRPDGRELWQAYARTEGVATLDDMARLIEKRTTVSRADVLAVVAALTETAAEALEDGRIVRLGELGSLRPTLSAKASDTREAFDARTIRLSARFKPGRAIRLALLDAQRALSRERTAPGGGKNPGNTGEKSREL